MAEEPIELFQRGYYDWLADFEADREGTGDPRTSTGGASIDTSAGRTEIEVVRELYDHTRELVTVADEGVDGEVERKAVVIVHRCLDYLDRWGNHTPITAEERERGVVDRGDEEPPLPPIHRLKKLFEDKGEDYESDDITYLEYCILDHWSVIHEVHKKAQRLYSVTKGGDPNFEKAEDSVFDLCNYTLFLLAYLDLPDDLDYNWVMLDVE